LEASIEVHTKKVPKEQKDTAKAVNTNLPKRDQSRGRESITCYRCGKVGHFWSDCKEAKVLCSKCDSTNYATSMCRKEPEGKMEDEKKDKKEKQRQSRQTKEDDKKAKENKKKAKTEKHKARKMTPRRQRKASVSESSFDSDSHSDSNSESESTSRVKVRCSVNIGSNATPRMDCLISKMNSRHKHVYQPLPDSGATRSIIGTDVIQELRLRYDKHSDTKVKLFNPSGEPMKVEGYTTFRIKSEGC
jgi:hypothetical protein